MTFGQRIELWIAHLRGKKQALKEAPRAVRGRIHGGKGNVFSALARPGGVLTPSRIWSRQEQKWYSLEEWQKRTKELS